MKDISCFSFTITLLLLIITINALLPDETKFTECEGGPYPNTISNFQINPDPLVIGQSASYTFNGTRNVEILEGSRIDFLLIDENNEIIFKNMEYICSIVNEKCPLPIGNYEFTYGLNLNILEESSENVDMPPKTFLLYFTIKDPKEIILSCIQGPVELSYVYTASFNGNKKRYFHLL
ncbi:5029_t:CDS:2 [Funneliformis geosporum]|uniref:Phosphatidylglycerol/phosphatidylinositol transfer protein n=1 Tax=Funneliformis geosporum TaxID=1117311 RepID=A0A9W4SK30_9GLOM|nr:5029_t:CDS:2 [Funneliformis geosporum]CAI2172409.1 14129_t:CDS:2 [Funneliformis geosporum]